ncbi:MAG: 3-deoxy-7-phosphoheptulonate synthase [SAR324 cluster bacterium]|nr:3-deoxy-7-phosphoheptulonate synthase [SAR324 cluster bacterium]
MTVDRRIENINVYSEDPLITPTQLKKEFPHTDKHVETIRVARNRIFNIMDRKEHRLFVVVGPCSIHDVDAAMEYAVRLKKLAEEVNDTLMLVMRVYFEKPRTTVGWQGLINDPYLDGSGQIEEGLRQARKLLVDLAELGMPAAGEALDLVSPQYVQDLISWTAIGARTTESQNHRKMASALSTAVGFKNATNGDLAVAVNALLSAARSNHFLSVDPEGHVAVIRTKGNPYTHVVLRGGSNGPNYGTDEVATCEKLITAAGLDANIMVDCSHANSEKDPAKQLVVMDEITDQIINGNQSIIGLMIESNLEWGNQPIANGVGQLKYGVSVTDPCIDWNTTASAIRKMHQQLMGVLPKRNEGSHRKSAQKI